MPSYLHELNNHLSNHLVAIGTLTYTVHVLCIDNTSEANSIGKKFVKHCHINNI